MKRIINYCVSAVFVLVIFGFSAAFWLSPDRDFSEEENRTLAQAPKATVAGIVDGTFSSDMNEYFADQFFARDSLVGIKGVVETALLKGENNGVLLGKNNQLATRLFTMYKSRLEQTPDTDFIYTDTVSRAIKRLNQYAEKETRPLITLFPPRTVDVATSAFSYPDRTGEALHDLIGSSISDSAGYLDLFGEFRSLYQAGQPVYYRTDHHWTAKGAYTAYAAIMKKWGLAESTIPESKISYETVPDFYGTTWSKAGMKFVAAESMKIPVFPNEQSFVTKCLREQTKRDENNKPVTERSVYKTFRGYLNRDYFKQKNKYAAFLDGTHNEQTVTLENGQNREKLLLVKDSFANSLVPYLAQHFDLVIVNLSNGMSDVSRYAQEFGCDRVLIVYNYENLTENSNLAAIN